MPLTLTADIPQAAVHVLNLRATQVDHVGVIVNLVVDKLDAQGNVLATVQVALGPAASAAFSAAIKTAIYNQLQTALGVTGTVT